MAAQPDDIVGIKLEVRVMAALVEARVFGAAGKPEGPGCEGYPPRLGILFIPKRFWHVALFRARGRFVKSGSSSRCGLQSLARITDRRGQ